MTRRMEDLNRHIAKLKHVAVMNAPKWRRGLRIVEKDVVGACGLRERPCRGDVVRMQVGVDDIENSHSGFRGGIEVDRDVADGIDDRA